MFARSRLPSDDSSWWVPATANRPDRHLTIPATALLGDSHPCEQPQRERPDSNSWAITSKGVENLGTGVAPEGKTHATAEGLFSQDL